MPAESEGPATPSDSASSRAEKTPEFSPPSPRVFDSPDSSNSASSVGEVDSPDDFAQDTNAFQYPFPAPQLLPLIDALNNDPALLRLLHFYQGFGPRKSLFNEVLPSSQQSPQHFTSRSILHTTFLIKKVSTVQCDECKLRGKGVETYKCTHCANQICRPCVEGLLIRETAQHEEQGGNNEYKWSWQGLYRHEGFKQCFIARDAANCKGDFHVDIPLSVLGLPGRDDITVYMVRDYNDEDIPRGQKRARHGTDSESLDDNDDDAPTPDTPSKKSRKRRRRPVSPNTRLSAQRQGSNERTRQELPPRTSDILNRIQGAATAANNATQARPSNTAAPARQSFNRWGVAPLDYNRPPLPPSPSPPPPRLPSPFTTAAGQPLRRFTSSQEVLNLYGRPPLGFGSRYVPPMAPEAHESAPAAQMPQQPPPALQTYQQPAPQPQIQEQPHTGPHMPYSGPHMSYSRPGFPQTRPQTYQQQRPLPQPQAYQQPQRVQQHPPPLMFAPPPGTLLMVPDDAGTVHGLTWDQYQQREWRSRSALPPLHLPGGAQPHFNTVAAQEAGRPHLNRSSAQPAPPWRPQNVAHERGGRATGAWREDMRLRQREPDRIEASTSLYGRPPNVVPPRDEHYGLQNLRSMVLDRYTYDVMAGNRFQGVTVLAGRRVIQTPGTAAAHAMGSRHGEGLDRIGLVFTGHYGQPFTQAARRWGQHRQLGRITRSFAVIIDLEGEDEEVVRQRYFQDQFAREQQARREDDTRTRQAHKQRAQKGEASQQQDRVQSRQQDTSFLHHGGGFEPRTAPMAPPQSTLSAGRRQSGPADDATIHDHDDASSYSVPSPRPSLGDMYSPKVSLPSPTVRGPRQSLDAAVRSVLHHGLPPNTGPDSDEASNASSDARLDREPGIEQDPENPRRQLATVNTNPQSVPNLNAPSSFRSPQLHAQTGHSPLQNLLLGYYSPDDDSDHAEVKEEDDTESDHEVPETANGEEVASEHVDGSVQPASVGAQVDSPVQPTPAAGPVYGAVRTAPAPRGPTPPVYYNARHAPMRAEASIVEMRRDDIQRRRLRQALAQIPEARELGLPYGPLTDRDNSWARITGGRSPARGRSPFRAPLAGLHLNGDGHASVITNPGPIVPPMPPRNQKEPTVEPSTESQKVADSPSKPKAIDDDDWEDVADGMTDKDSDAASNAEDESDAEPADPTVPPSPTTPTRRTRSGNEYTGVARRDLVRSTGRSAKTSGSKEGS